jgi:hypothetical protein
VGDNVQTKVATVGGLTAAVTKLLAIYYIFDIAYPREFVNIMAILQEFVMEEPVRNVSSLSSRYKHFLSKLKSSYDSVLPPPEEI